MGISLGSVMAPVAVSYTHLDVGVDVGVVIGRLRILGKALACGGIPALEGTLAVLLALGKVAGAVGVYPLRDKGPEHVQHVGIEHRHRPVLTIGQDGVEDLALFLVGQHVEGGSEVEIEQNTGCILGQSEMCIRDRT